MDKSHHFSLAGSSVLVTGGAGFIGSHLVEALLSLGAQVSVIDNFATGQRSNIVHLDHRIDLYELDLLEVDIGDILNITAFDAIFHLAANAYVPPSVENPTFDYFLNLHTTFRLLEAMRLGQSKSVLVYASSAAVYGDPPPGAISEDDSVFPISPYGVSKLAAERYVAVFSKLYGLRAASARLFSVYGPRQRKQVVYDLICKAESDPHRLAILGDGSQQRDFNYVTDTIGGLMHIAEHGRLQGEVYNVGSGQSISISKLASAICETIGVQPSLDFSGEVRPGDPEVWVADISRLNNIGYVPRVSLMAGLGETWNWYRSMKDG